MTSSAFGALTLPPRVTRYRHGNKRGTCRPWNDSVLARRTRSGGWRERAIHSKETLAGPPASLPFASTQLSCVVQVQRRAVPSFSRLGQLVVVHNFLRVLHARVRQVPECATRALKAR